MTSAAPAVTVNGQPWALDGLAVHTNALDLLRGRGLTGAKEGCAEGECGACAVLLARADGSGGTAWVAVNACLVPALALDGQEVVTAEGLGDPAALHPVQAALVRTGGSQCGYCTPGFVCSMAAEFYRPARVCVGEGGTEHGTADDVEADTEHGPNGFDLHALSGNLCRCTGYRPIRDAAWGLGEPDDDDPLARRRAEPPPRPAATRAASAEGEFIRPRDLPEALDLLREHPGATLLAGGTDWSVAVNLQGARSQVTLAVDRLPELRTLTVGDGVLEVGAALSLSELERDLAGRVPLLSELFPQFGSRLIRNSATLGGNLATGSPIGDGAPVLLALDAFVVLASADGDREVPLAEYFTGYRRSVRRADEILRAVRIPLPLSPVTAFYKVAKRRYDDISSVAIALALDVRDGVVRDARIGLGGVAATPVRALATEAALRGRPWSEGVVTEAATVLRGEGTPLDDHRASAAYRSAMLGQALPRLFARYADGRRRLDGATGRGVQA